MEYEKINQDDSFFPNDNVDLRFMKNSELKDCLRHGILALNQHEAWSALSQFTPPKICWALTKLPKQLETVRKLMAYNFQYTGMTMGQTWAHLSFISKNGFDAYRSLQNRDDLGF